MQTRNLCTRSSRFSNWKKYALSCFSMSTARTHTRSLYEAPRPPSYWAESLRWKWRYCLRCPWSWSWHSLPFCPCCSGEWAWCRGPDARTRCDAVQKTSLCITYHYAHTRRAGCCAYRRSVFWKLWNFAMKEHFVHLLWELARYFQVAKRSRALGDTCSIMQKLFLAKGKVTRCRNSFSCPCRSLIKTEINRDTCEIRSVCFIGNMLRLNDIFCINWAVPSCQTCQSAQGGQ